LAYQIRGAGAPAIFIQGVGVHGSAWTPQLDALASNFECLAFDNRGLGRSQPLGCPLTIEQMAEDTLALMDARGWPSAHVVGHSMGGLIALRVALEARSRVRSLSLLCSFPRGRDPLRITRTMLWTGLRTRIGTKAQRRRAFLSMVMPPSALAGTDWAALARELEPLFGHDLADQPSVVPRQMTAMARHDVTPRLSELAGLPTLVVSAEHDWLAPPKIGRAMAAAIPGARFVEIPDASHGACIQHAAQINALLLEHLRAY
jgi:pimeloyl-ACP methyl ester carboxylesterase